MIVHEPRQRRFNMSPVNDIDDLMSAAPGLAPQPAGREMRGRSHARSQPLWLIAGAHHHWTRLEVWGASAFARNWCWTISMRPLARGAIDPRQRSLDQAARKVEIIGRAPLVRGSRSRSTRQTAAQALEPHLLPQKLTSIAAGFAAAGLRQPPSRARCLAVRI